MNGKAFEEWVRTVDKSLSLHKVPDGGYKYPRTKSAWSAWKSSHAAALERAAEVCEAIENGENPDGSLAAGLSWECVQAIRALKD